MLPLLWARHKGHPNLLPAFFEEDPRASQLQRAASKPYFSREGENVTLLENGVAVDAATGDYGAERRIVQEYVQLFEADGQHAVLGSWVIGDRAAGLGLREDTSRITRNLSRFVPHIIASA
jgi:glutathionylspermidine synthase